MSATVYDAIPDFYGIVAFAMVLARASITESIEVEFCATRNRVPMARRNTTGSPSGAHSARVHTVALRAARPFFHPLPSSICFTGLRGTGDVYLPRSEDPNGK